MEDPGLEASQTSAAKGAGRRPGSHTAILRHNRDLDGDDHDVGKEGKSEGGGGGGGGVN